MGRPQALRMRVRKVVDDGTATLDGKGYLLHVSALPPALIDLLTKAGADEDKVAVLVYRSRRRCELWGQPVQFALTLKTGIADFDNATPADQVRLVELLQEHLAGRRTLTNQPQQQSLALTRDAYSPADLQRMLPLGRAAVYALAAAIGHRVGKKRWLVGRDALQRYLTVSTTPTTTEDADVKVP